ncbi:MULTISPECIES: DUF2490 domain-containing protein [Hymenobacter]|uniref:DUF2490 domain-containing protein n=1 Tax=Hymenobacter mucosus TaxID=1411120 RepID=A0A238YMY0_9BACT|nr:MULTISPECIES: DUF2490 domain-containing protein [Hymenobacter]SNR72497.1 Protein of unknown function [Hymenobacter mucosus]
MKLNVLFLVVGAWLLTTTALAQGDKAKYSSWLQYNGTCALGPRFDVNTVLQYRSYNTFGDSRLLLGNANLQYNLKSLPASVAAGYMYLQLRPFSNPEETEKFDRRENRLYQQLIVNNKFGRSRLLHRYRVEERWTAAGFAMRFRYLASLRVPLGPRTIENASWYATLKDEIRISDGPQPFDSNRIWAGVGHVFNKNLGVEGLWMTQLEAGGNHNHYVALLIRHDFGWPDALPTRRPRFLPQ